jgi:RimJ/RimL family protein N-acetyltransferase
MVRAKFSVDRLTRTLYAAADRRPGGLLLVLNRRLQRLIGDSELLQGFTRVDHANHVALVAEIFEDGREMVIGEARYVRAADQLSAEVSVSVADPWQGKGLAKLMLTKLERRAAAVGIRRIIGETLATNEKVLSFAHKAGFVISESARGVMWLEKTLAP